MTDAKKDPAVQPPKNVDPNWAAKIETARASKSAAEQLRQGRPMGFSNRRQYRAAN